MRDVEFVETMSRLPVHTLVVVTFDPNTPPAAVSLLHEAAAEGLVELEPSTSFGVWYDGVRFAEKQVWPEGFEAPHMRSYSIRTNGPINPKKLPRDLSRAIEVIWF